MKKVALFLLAATVFFASCSGTSKQGKVIGITTTDNKDTASQRKFQRMSAYPANVTAATVIVTVATASDTIDAICSYCNEVDNKSMPVLNEQVTVTNKLTDKSKYYVVRN